MRAREGIIEDIEYFNPRPEQAIERCDDGTMIHFGERIEKESCEKINFASLRSQCSQSRGVFAFIYVSICSRKRAIAHTWSYKP